MLCETQSHHNHLHKRGRVDSDAEGKGLKTKFPLILSITQPESKSFNDLSFFQLNDFVNKLESLVKPVSHTRIASRGDLFIYPVDEVQKNLILQLSPITIDTFQIDIFKTKAEIEFKGVIYGVPTHEPDEIINSLLIEQGAIGAIRIYKTITEGKIPTRTWVLTFSTTPQVILTLPPGAISLQHIHVDTPTASNVRPSKCINPERCRVCSENHLEFSDCTAPPRCPNCTSPSHVGGSPDCPEKALRQKILDLSSSQNIPFQILSYKLSHNPLTHLKKKM